MVAVYLVEGQLNPPSEVVLLSLSPVLQLVGVVSCHVAVMESQLLVRGGEEKYVHRSLSPSKTMEVERCSCIPSPSPSPPSCSPLPLPPPSLPTSPPSPSCSPLPCCGRCTASKRAPAAAPGAACTSPGGTLPHSISCSGRGPLPHPQLAICVLPGSRS